MNIDRILIGYHNKKTFNFENLENLKIVDERYEILEKDQEINL